MSKVRVHEVAKELGVTSKELIEKLRGMGVEVKSHSSTIDDEVAAQLRNGGAAAPAEAPAEAAPAPEPVAASPAPAHEPEPEPVAEEPAAPAAIHVHRGITVKDFAGKIGRSPAEVIKSLMSQGSMKSITQSLTDEEILVVADDLGAVVEVVDPDSVAREQALDDDAAPPDSLDRR